MEDEDDIPDVADIAPAKKVVPRDYQVAAVDAGFSEWDGGVQSTLIVSPTGTGKSVIFSEVMRRAIKEGK